MYTIDSTAPKLRDSSLLKAKITAHVLAKELPSTRERETKIHEASLGAGKCSK